MFNTLTRRALLAAAAGSALLLSTPAFAAAKQGAAVTNTYNDWFRIGAAAQENWRIVGDPDDPNIAHVIGHDRKVGDAAQKVMAVYPRPSSAYDVAITQILSVFAAKGLDTEVLAYNFKKDDVRGQAALTYAESNGYDLILSMGSESTAWLYGKYQGGKLPVISVCSKDPVLLGQAKGYDQGTSTNFALTSLNMPVEVQISYISQVLPDMKNMGILVDGRNVSAVETQAKPMGAYARQRGLQVIDMALTDPKNAKAELQTLVADAVALMRKSDPTLERSLFWMTGSTAVFREIETVNAHADRVPVLSVVPEVVNGTPASAVLSIGISFESNAHLAAIYAGEVLAKRKTAGSMSVGIVSPPDIAINFKKAREIGLRVPFNFFESATYIYGYDGKLVRNLRVASITSSSK